MKYCTEFSGLTAYIPKDLRTVRCAMSLNFCWSSRQVLAASTFAALSSLGSEMKTSFQILMKNILCFSIQNQTKNHFTPIDCFSLIQNNELKNLL